MEIPLQRPLHPKIPQPWFAECPWSPLSVVGQRVTELEIGQCWRQSNGGQGGKASTITPPTPSFWTKCQPIGVLKSGQLGATASF